MPKASKKIPSGRNDPRHGVRDKRERDLAMKSGDLRGRPVRIRAARARALRKKRSLVEASSGVTPFYEAPSFSTPRPRRLSK